MKKTYIPFIKRKTLIELATIGSFKAYRELHQRMISTTNLTTGQDVYDAIYSTIEARHHLSYIARMMDAVSGLVKPRQGMYRLKPEYEFPGSRLTTRAKTYHATIDVNDTATLPKLEPRGMDFDGTIGEDHTIIKLMEKGNHDE